MTSMAGSTRSKMQHPRVKSPGWAAFDVSRQQKHSTESELSVDPYPPVSNSQGPRIMINHCPLTRPFSSVVQPSINLPSPIDNLRTGNLNGNGSMQITVDTHAISSLERLQNVHGWADDSLIEDILAAVNNDEEQATALLKSMVSSDSVKEEQVKLQGPSSVLKDHLSNEEDCSSESLLSGNKPSDDANGELISRHFLSAPVEPEWEEDDIYLSRRKDAIKMMRMAAQHSKSASSAYLRGDHSSAHQLSLKAQEEWISADKLNVKASEEILNIRNSSNHDWKLDLHGLHASEAVNALKERLHRIESHVVVNKSFSLDGIAKLEMGIHSLSLGSVGEDMGAQASKQQALPRQRQTVLHVITGTGNHSRGQAALPTAVRSFLIENGYQFDDARPGVISVRPKFRHIYLNGETK